LLYFNQLNGKSIPQGKCKIKKNLFFSLQLLISSFVLDMFLKCYDSTKKNKKAFFEFEKGKAKCAGKCLLSAPTKRNKVFRRSFVEIWESDMEKQMINQLLVFTQFFFYQAHLKHNFPLIRLFIKKIISTFGIWHSIFHISM
jgi:hypothetical protein